MCQSDRTRYVQKEMEGVIVNEYETTEQLVRRLLLSGRKIDKTIMRKESDINSDCLSQRIKDIRYKTDWNIKSQTVKGKGSLKEFWLEPEEIERIKGKIETVEPRYDEDEQLAFAVEKTAPERTENAQDENYEQLGIGILGGRNY